ncbi:ComF operon protein [Lentibacillus sp. JNUCC-1]|uniref:DEAD/DEAH box helicase n=1 Tax=Lentibacillus sp. JNUCC-1 TaxID=2654513 RepID=UPI0012E96DEB|nr:helicase-related protein [Lentibacillus sp. JNUCC-1]MUV39051.1 ComF operon protein [Lentibacillus sp. JNUCC-1]
MSFQSKPHLPSTLHLRELSIKFAGKLLLRDELNLITSDIELLISQGCLQPLPSFEHRLTGPECARCGNRKNSLIGHLSCASCGEEHIYCRKCIEMGRVLACQPLYAWAGAEADWPTHPAPCTWTGELTQAQQQAADSVASAIQTRMPELLIWAVCGAGKTEMLFPGITQALQLGLRICIATPRADVVRELKPRIQKAFAEIPVQALYGGSPEREASAQLILATTHQLLRFKSAFDVMIIDEIDAFPFHADPSLPFAANRAKKSVCTTIYLTATPRTQQQRLLTNNKLPHVFVPTRYHGHPLPVPSMHMTFQLQKNLRENRLSQTCVQWMRNRDNMDRQLLIFVPAIALADNLVESVRELFLKEGWIEENAQVCAVHSEDPNRTEKVERFRQKKLKVIITTTILERGVTFPSVDVMVLNAGHEVFDEAALVQIAGRAGRSSDDPYGEVVFFHDGKTDAMVQAIRHIRLMNEREGWRS